jgi:hypothetical protein
MLPPGRLSRRTNSTQPSAAERTARLQGLSRSKRLEGLAPSALSDVRQDLKQDLPRGIREPSSEREMVADSSQDDHNTHDAEHALILTEMISGRTKMLFNYV